MPDGAPVEALRAVLSRAPEPANLRRPNAVRAFLHRWRQWRAEAAELVAALDGALADTHSAAPQSAAGGPRDAARSASATVGWPRRLTPAQARAVAAEMLAARGRAPSGAELVAVLRERFGISRASAYRALKSETHARRHGPR